MPEMNQEFLQKLLSGKYNAEKENHNREQTEKPDNAQDVTGLATTAPLPSLKRDTELEDLPIDLLTDYPDQPLPPYTDDEMAELVDSIRANGVITPLLVRPHDKGYQIIDGRNRRNGARKAGYNTVPCIVRDLSDDDAAICLVETIFRQRDMSKVSTMQKAHAYRLWLDAMKRQGRRYDLTSSHNCGEVRSDDLIGQESGVSGDTVQRLIRLTYLIPEFQDRVDEGSNSFPLMASVLISYLNEDNQAAVNQFFFTDHDYGISIKTAEKLREEDNAGTAFNQDFLNDLWSELGTDKPMEAKEKPFVIPPQKMKIYFAPEATRKEKAKIIFEALDFYYEAKKIKKYL